jgi:hypothetical protein
VSLAAVPIISLVTKFVDKFVQDKDQAETLKQQFALEAMKGGQSELEQATKVILAEAGGESWLQRNWRPMLMLWFAGLVGAHWLGFTPENLSEDTVQSLLSIVRVGIGGYVLGRSGEKMMKAYKEK